MVSWKDVQRALLGPDHEEPDPLVQCTHLNGGTRCGRPDGHPGRHDNEDDE